MDQYIYDGESIKDYLFSILKCLELTLQKHMRLIAFEES